VNKPAYTSGAASIYQAPGPLDVRSYEWGGILDAPVNVAFGGKVDRGVAIFRNFGYGRVRNVQPDKLHPRVQQRPFQVVQVSGVGQFVEDNKMVRGVIPEDLMDEIRSDESCSSGDKNAHG
jgi:hypothetical protein